MTNNNNTTEKNTMKFYNITAIDPCTERETLYAQVPAKHLRQNESGELLFRYNSYYDSVEVIKSELVQELTHSDVTMNGKYSCE